jgi:hypothetical protein
MVAKCGNCGVESSGRFCPECGHDKESGASPAGISPAIAPAGVTRAMTTRPPEMNPQTIPVDSTAPIEQLQGRFREINAGTVTARGGRMMTDEGMVWEEKPSPVLLLGLIAKYVIAVILTVLLFGNVPQSSGEGTFLLLLFVVGVIHVGMRFWELTSTKYRMTSQRLEVTSGLFNQTTVTFELHQMAPGQITRPLFLRLVKRGNLYIPAPPIFLRAIRNPEVVRDMLRDFGQREASRMDKIRWR